jgi:spore germination protein GerM
LTPTQRNTLLSIALLGALFFGITLSAPYWSAALRIPVETGSAGEQGEETGDEPSTAATASPTVARLFFAATDRPGLLIEERNVPFSADLSHQVRLVVEEVLKGPTGGLRATFPSEAKVLDAFVTPRGIAIVNLSKEAVVNGRGTDGELVAVYSVVNSVISTFPSLKRVQILVESSPTLTLGGHVDLSRPLAADTSFLAVDEAGPSPSTPPQP